MSRMMKIKVSRNSVVHYGFDDEYRVKRPDVTMHPATTKNPSYDNLDVSRKCYSKCEKHKNPKSFDSLPGDTGYICLDHGLKYGFCDPKANMIVTRTHEIPKSLPHEFPQNAKQRMENEDARAHSGARPNIFTNALDDLKTGVGRILKGQNVFTGDPVLGGGTRPLEIAP
jgi:hypothetical protein